MFIIYANKTVNESKNLKIKIDSVKVDESGVFKTLGYLMDRVRVGHQSRSEKAMVEFMMINEGL